MKKKLRFSSLVMIWMLLISMQLKAQNKYHFQAKIDGVQKSQFYAINLPVNVTAKCQPSLSDIRIIDDDEQQVAYILKASEPIINETTFTKFEVQSIKKGTDSQTHVVIKSLALKPITSLVLATSNTDAERIIDISGSNDLKNWYVLKEHVYLNNSANTVSTEVLQPIQFPLSNYQYYQITFLGKNLLPPNILQAGIYKDGIIEGQFTKLPNASISQKDSSDKRTYVSFQFDAHYPIDKLSLNLQGSKFFKRLASLYTINNTVKTFVKTLTLSSNSSLEFPLNTYADKLLLVIDNDDNKPLKVNEINAYQLNKYLLTYLEAKKNYRLLFGDSTAVAAKYDLDAFKDSISKQPTSIGIMAIETVSLNVQNNATKANNYTSIVLWMIIIIVLVILLLLVKNMLKQVGKSN